MVVFQRFVADLVIGLSLAAPAGDRCLFLVISSDRGTDTRTDHTTDGRIHGGVLNLGSADSNADKEKHNAEKK